MGTRLNRLDEAVLTSTHNLCFEQKYKKYQNFYLKNCHFLVVKFSMYLNRRVFVMFILFALHCLYFSVMDHLFQLVNTKINEVRFPIHNFVFFNTLEYRNIYICNNHCFISS